MTDNTTAIGGAHPGTKTKAEMQAGISTEVDNNKDISTVAGQMIKSAEWHMNSFSDPNRSPKYAVDPETSYYGAGSLSLLSRAGKFIFAANTNEANRGAFSLDQNGSSMYSTMSTTTFGSLKIDTVDGYELNQLSTTFPSTNFSPTKPWVKKLFPTLSAETLVSVAILELVAAALLTLVDKDKNQPEISESKLNVDMALIIQDNQILEDQIFNDIQELEL